jgi:hypothetical protein
MEIKTYARRNKILIHNSVHSQPYKQAPYHLLKQVPSQSTGKGVQPLPPPIHDLLPKPMQTDEEIQLNIDVPTMVGNMNVLVPMV